MVVIVGAVFQLLGLLSGLFLTLAPFGLGPATPGAATWIMFPALCIAGYIFLAMAARTTSIAMVSMLVGGALLVLALLATVGLFIAAPPVLSWAGSVAPLWDVMAVGFVLGGAGFSLRRVGAQPQA